MENIKLLVFFCDYRELYPKKKDQLDLAEEAMQGDVNSFRATGIMN